MWSVRRQLLAWLLSGIALVGVAASAAAYFQVREEVDELFDRQLRQIALSLRDQKDLTANPPDSRPEEEDAIAFAAWEHGSEVLRWPAHAVFPRHEAAGYATLSMGQGLWRVFVQPQGDRTIEVAQPLSARRRMALAMALEIVAPIVLMMVALAALVWIIVERTLAPFSKLTAALEARSPTDLERVPTDLLPRELLPPVDALNRLLERLRKAVETQQNFVADAAHELRTPLTALNLQLDLLHTSTSEEDRARSAKLVHTALARLTHLSQQLLTMARLEPAAPAAVLARVDLTELATTLIGEFWPLARVRDIELGMSRREQVEVLGDVEALDFAIRNIIDNAIRYTPGGGEVDVSVLRDRDLAIVQVTDTGNGIPAEERERVFDRFYRGSP